jgi:hypothetical protein
VAASASVVLANLLPLVGVMWFGWDPRTLAVVYGLELLVAFPVAGVKALFADRPPVTDRESGVVSVEESDLVEKRGSVTVANWLPPIYPRNVAFAAAVVGVGTQVAIFVLVALSEVTAVGTVLGRPAVLTSALALGVGQLVETVVYLRAGRYEGVSPYAVVEIPARQGLFLAFVLVVVAGVDPTGVVVVTGFVLVKTLSDYAGLRTEHAGTSRLTDWFAGPDEEVTLDPVETPDGPTTATVAVNRRSAAAAALWRAVTTVGPFYVTMVTIVWIVGAGVLGGADATRPFVIASTLAAVVLFGTLLAGDVLERLLTTGWMAYHRVGDHLVAVDRLTGDPQWAVPVSELRDVGVVETASPDRYFGTRTFTVKVGWGEDTPERTLGPVDDPERLLESFDLDGASVALSPLDRWFAGAAVLSLVAILGVVFGAMLSPALPFADGLFLLFGFPFLTLVPRGFWRLARSRADGG